MYSYPSTLLRNEAEEEEEEGRGGEGEGEGRGRERKGGRAQKRARKKKGKRSHPQTHAFTIRERWSLFLSLWPYTVPLVSKLAGSKDPTKRLLCRRPRSYPLLEAITFSLSPSLLLLFLIGYRILGGVCDAVRGLVGHWLSRRGREGSQDLLRVGQHVLSGAKSGRAGILDLHAKPIYLLFLSYTSLRILVTLNQIGVFLSRSSGMLLPPSLPLLWTLPALQCLLLLFFCLNAIWHFWCVYIPAMTSHRGGHIQKQAFIHSWQRDVQLKTAVHQSHDEV